MINWKHSIVATLLLLTTGVRGEAFPFGNSGKKEKKQSPTSQPAPALHDKWAVLIGISNFKDATIPPIKYGAESAGKLGRVFLEPSAGNFHNDHMVVLQQDDAVKSTIEDVLTNGITTKCLPSDLIVLYISSRWTPAKNGKDIILLTTDAKLSDAEGTGINLATVLSTIRRRTQSRNILCLLDLSPVKEGGNREALIPAIAKGKSAENGLIERLAEQTNVNIISANNLITNSAQTPFTESSYFCRFLMEDLRGSSGTVTISTLSRMISEQVHGTVQGEQKVDQQPESSLATDTLANVAIGLIINKTKNLLVAAGLPSNLGTMKFGIEGSRMPIDHPELLPGSGIGTPVAAPTARAPRKSYVAQSQSAVSPAPQPATPAAPVSKASPPAAAATKAEKLSKSERSEKESRELKNQEKDDDDDEPTADIDLGPYITAAKKSIQSKWQPPKGLENHKVVTILTILRDGTIQDTQLIEPSGIAAVDQAALDALKAASPLAPLPAGSPRSIQLRYKFEWRVRKD